MPRPRSRWLLLALPALLPAMGCATIRQLSQLPQVDFHLDRASDPALAGVDLARVRRFEELRPGDLLRVAAAARAGRLPLTFQLHVGADNPSANRYDLRLERLEWTLLLEDRETVSGVYDGDLVIPAGGATELPIAVELDLLRFFDEGASDLARLAIRAVGAGEPQNLKLRARPTLRTPLGSIRFPNEITIVSRDL